MQHCRIGRVRFKQPDNVLWWGGLTRLDLPPAYVLAGALEANLAGVVVLGHTADGREYMASSLADGPDMLWLLERGKHRLMQVVT